MDETIAQIARWLAAGEQVAAATVVQVMGSAPRPLGARLAVTDRGDLVGSVSGGCVEGAVIQEAEAVLRDGVPRRVRYGISDERGWEVGLACGGIIDVLIQPAEPILWRRLADEQQAGRPCAMITVIDPDSAHLGHQAVLDTSTLPRCLVERGPVAERLQSPLAGIDVGIEVLVEPFLPRPQLVIVGAVHTARPLTRMAQMLGFRVVVVDPRGRFADRDRFPEADEIRVEWPDQALAELALDGRSAVVVLTHDPKIDEPALQAALQTDAYYLGAIGSRKTHADRFSRLAHLGEDCLARIHGPIGLDIGAQSPEELALSILAEIVAARHGRRGDSLRDQGRPGTPGGAPEHDR